MRINFRTPAPEDDNFDAEDFESELLPDELDEGPLRAYIAADPEHDRMLDPAY